MVKPGKCRSWRAGVCAHRRIGAARLAEGERRSAGDRFRVSSDEPGPTAARRDVTCRSSPPRRARGGPYSAPADQRCSRHLLYSPEIEYFACESRTSPRRLRARPRLRHRSRKSCRVRVRVWGHAGIVHNRGSKSVTNEHWQVENFGGPETHGQGCNRHNSERRFAVCAGEGTKLRAYRRHPYRRLVCVCGIMNIGAPASPHDTRRHLNTWINI